MAEEKSKEKNNNSKDVAGSKEKETVSQTAASPKSNQGWRPIGRRRRFSRSEEKKDQEFETKLLDLARVVRVSAGGKKLRFRAVMIMGNKQGKIGLGVAKGLDVAQAVEKATRSAKKNLIEVPIKDNTILHQVEAKSGAAKVLLKPQRKGKGLVAGGTVRIICRLAGIKDISSKVLGRTGNKLNNARATILALSKLRLK